MTQYELEAIRQNGKWPVYQEFRRELTKAGPYWDFSGYNELARNDRLYADVQHFKPVLGNLMLRWMESGGHDECCGELSKELAKSALRVEQGNVDRVLEAQDQRLKENSAVGNYAKIVSDLRSRLSTMPTQRERL